MFEVKRKAKVGRKSLSLGCYFKREERANAESLLDELDKLVSNLGIKIFHKKVVRVRKDLLGISYRKGKI